MTAAFGSSEYSAVIELLVPVLVPEPGLELELVLELELGLELVAEPSHDVGPPVVAVAFEPVVGPLLYEVSLVVRLVAVATRLALASVFEASVRSLPVGSSLAPS